MISIKNDVELKSDEENLFFSSVTNLLICMFRFYLFYIIYVFYQCILFFFNKYINLKY